MNFARIRACTDTARHDRWLARAAVSSAAARALLPAALPWWSPMIAGRDVAPRYDVVSTGLPFPIRTPADCATLHAVVRSPDDDEFVVLRFDDRYGPRSRRTRSGDEGTRARQARARDVCDARRRRMLVGRRDPRALRTMRRRRRSRGGWRERPTRRGRRGCPTCARRRRGDGGRCRCKHRCVNSPSGVGLLVGRLRRPSVLRMLCGAARAARRLCFRSRVRAWLRVLL